MLLILAATLQCLLIFECVLRRVLMVFFPSKRSAVQRFADTNMFATGAAAVVQAATLPLQAFHLPQAPGKHA